MSEEAAEVVRKALSSTLRLGSYDDMTRIILGALQAAGFHLHRGECLLKDELRQVWLVEGGEYEQRYIACVGVTLDAAVAALKVRYDDTYRLRWHDLSGPDAGDAFYISADFEAVPGKSTKHTADWRIWPESLIDQDTPEAHA